jgi:hypothetical protein
MSKGQTARTQRYREKNPRKSFAFKPEEAALLERAKERAGSEKAAIMAALAQYMGTNEISDKELLAQLAARLKR